MHIERSHAITVPLPIGAAFPLFTPKGEMDWVDGWTPVFFHPTSGDTQAGMVFTTDIGGVLTYWACTDWAPHEHRVRYARVTPGNRFGFVEVRCSAAGANETRVDVSYAFTALSPEGEAYLADITPTAFAAMIGEWERLISERIVRR